MQNLDYEQVIEIIENKRRFGNLTGVEISEKMLEQLQHPEQKLPIIHVAGTNGKGSVSAFLCSILQEAGLKTGMFTSPHLIDFRERIRVDGEMISKEAVKRIGNSLLEQDFGVFPTMFDYCLLMAVLYFKEQKCDVVIMETGLGGRLDSTNALGVPVVSVITKIGFDHMAILGNTLAEIATEKAGIIKNGTRVVLESQEKEAEDVLLAKVREMDVPYQMIDFEQIQMEGFQNRKQFFSYGKYQKIAMQMLGVHQYENAVAAMLAAEYFLTANQSKTVQGNFEDVIRKGIEQTKWKGRLEILSEKPFFMVDGAHNSNGVEALKRSLTMLFPGEKFHFIMGVMADKDYEVMVEELVPLAYDFVTVTVESSRALQGEALAVCIRKQGVPAKSSSQVTEVLTQVQNGSMSGDGTEKVIAFGSLYFIGEIEAFYKSVI